jgi:hypothetical protein
MNEFKKLRNWRLLTKSKKHTTLIPGPQIIGWVKERVC